MYKPSVLCRLAICQRFVLMILIWVIFLLGAVEIKRASESGYTSYDALKQLAVYGWLSRATQ
jgi:hypothetical protein